ncbi:uncharacterized protein BXIN_1488 [Babesia sp. Xinjiang]|uniref:uncharacterized protein n=1 Tax=Babesia sp. Xinjiang TaxID=462227 RepID=UPI000A23F4F0|nr:uncharacterized protein BXIN_1488 [Babesia sp. Xinjiang]ORM42263.1 hypothetical protein BXIN_1488 [Babesia sp. Xinjiang]
MLPTSTWQCMCVVLFVLCRLVADSYGIKTARITNGTVLSAHRHLKVLPKYERTFIASGLVSADSKVNGRHGRNSAHCTTLSVNNKRCAGHLSLCAGAGNLFHGLEDRAKTLAKNVNDCVRRLRYKLIRNKWCQKAQCCIYKVKQKLVNLSTAEQIMLAILGKWIYAFALPGFHILSPYQLIPITSGFGVDIGLDTIVSIGSYYVLRNSLNPPENQVAVSAKEKLIIPLIATGLLGSFYLSGYAAEAVDNAMLLFSAMDWPISVALQRSMRILLSHLSWVVIGAKILNYVVPLKQTKSSWFTADAKELWVYKAVAGYYVSCALYSITDIIFNAAEAIRKTLDPEFAEDSTELMENVLIEPAELIPSIIAAVGPCITAPWWEEMLYRIFVFKSLNIKLPRKIATCLAALIFSVHHMNHRSVLQLFSLGVLWSLIEQGTNNVFISIAIHSMWNMRIMLGTLLGK